MLGCSSKERRKLSDKRCEKHRPLISRQVVTCFKTMGPFHKPFWALTPNFCALRPTFEKLLGGVKVWRRAQKFGVRRKMVYEIDPMKDSFRGFF